MKKYKLKRWYPSLDVTLSVGDIIELTGRFKSFIGGGKYEFIHKTGDYSDVGFIKKCELNNPDFWELIEEEKPLFITEDGVEVFSDIDNLFAINLTYFSKTQNTLRSSRWLIDNPSYKVFSIESNADEYIWRNKRVFSYEDMMKAKHSIILTIEDIEKAAKERSEE